MSQIPNLANLLSPYNIVIFMLIFSRLSGMMIVAPFFSTIKAPVQTKIWFCALIAFIFYPLIKASNNFILPHDMPEFAILILIEFFIGYLIGFVANLLFEGARLAGSIISIQMGLSMSQALDPATGVQSTELSALYVYLTALVFLATGAYKFLFISTFNSFSAISIGTFPLFNATIVSSILQLSSKVFIIAFGIALPVFSVLLVTDILLGMMSKIMPQMNIYMVALPVKIYIGLFLFLCFLSATSGYLKNIINNYMQAINLLFT